MISLSDDDAPGIDSIESQISNYDSEASVLKFKTWVSKLTEIAVINITEHVRHLYFLIAGCKKHSPRVSIFRS